MEYGNKKLVFKENIEQVFYGFQAIGIDITTCLKD